MADIYIVHFNKKLKHAQHYLGLSTQLKKRIRCHVAGSGSKLMKAVVTAGITFRVFKIAEGERVDEIKMKSYKKASHFCPICNSRILSEYKEIGEKEWHK